MRSKFKIVSVILSLVLVLAAFPTMVAGASHYYRCNYAEFLGDVTVRDGTRFAPGDTFTKTWKLKNSGTCTWTAANYKLVLVSGSDAFGVATSHALTKDVLPGATVELTIPDMKAPATAGKHRSSWKLDNGAGEQFGVGWRGGVPIFAEINVVMPPAVTYDFTANAASASWSSGAGALTFPGTAGDPKGAVISQPTPKFESGVIASNPGLVVSPNNVNNGFIQGVYPPYTVKKGDRFQTTVGCEYGTFYCYVAFSLKYHIGTGPVYTLWNFREKYEGLTYPANINLDRLAGKNVSFILYMSAYGSPTGDSAIWGRPVIVGTGAPSPVVGWSSNDMGDFTFDFPANSVVSGVEEILLPIVPGTNLNRKYVNVETKPLAAAGDACLSSNPDPSAPTPVTFNGISFMKETGGDGGAGNFQKWVAYSAVENPVDPLTCVSLTFVLSYSSAGNWNPPRPEFNEAAESAVFDQIMERFEWVTP